MVGRRLFRVIVMSLCGLLWLSACGQKGALYLPDKDKRQRLHGEAGQLVAPDSRPG